MSNVCKWSASRLDCYKTCPWKYYLQYECEIFPVETAEALRVGTNWHEIQEVDCSIPGTPCPHEMDDSTTDCIFCAGFGVVLEKTEHIVMRLLDKRYGEGTCPGSKTPLQWEAEKAMLFYSYLGYKWYYQNRKLEVLSSEAEFEVPLINPESGRAVPNVKLRGRTDQILRGSDGMGYVQDFKSTSSSLDGDSDFWRALRMATQPTLYYYAALYGIEQGTLPNMPLGGVLYDVWHKPGIRPKKLTQGESKIFTGRDRPMYCDQMFEVRNLNGQYFVDGVLSELTPGAKEGVFALKETPGMYGARLMQDIVATPEKYFARREVPRTPEDVRKMLQFIISVNRTVKHLRKINGWWQNDKQCEATYRCSYISLCYDPNFVPGTSELPEGFICKKEKESD